MNSNRFSIKNLEYSKEIIEQTKDTKVKINIGSKNVNNTEQEEKLDLPLICGPFKPVSFKRHTWKKSKKVSFMTSSA